MDSIIDIVIQRAGGQKALATSLGITSAALTSWRHKRRVPAERVLEVAGLTGLSPNLIRPDLYPDPKWVPPKSAA